MEPWTARPGSSSVMPMIFRPGHRLLALTLLLALPACNGGGPQLTSGGDCPPGGAGCPCDGDKCYGDLECLGNTCINPNGDDDGASPASEPGTSEPPTSEPLTTESPTTDPLTTGVTQTSGATQTSGDTTTGGVTTVDPSTGSSTGAVVPGTTTTGDAESSTTLPDSTGPGDTTGPPEDPGLPEGAMCDIFVQDCAAGLKCTPYANSPNGSWNDSMCTKVVANPDKIGESCSAIGSISSGKDTCEADSMCFNIPFGGLDGGDCVAFCNGTPQKPTCDDPAMSCMINNGGFLSLCVPKCDPLLVDCAVGDVCIPNSAQGDFVCIFDASKGAGQGASCSGPNSCAPGFICITGTYVQNCVKNACCTDVCDTDLANTCAGMPTVTCRPFFSPGKAKPGYEDVGFCGLP